VAEVELQLVLVFGYVNFHLQNALYVEDLKCAMWKWGVVFGLEGEVIERS
jgi:hypothetical protein